jgi:hypothetical protein
MTTAQSAANNLHMHQLFPYQRLPYEQDYSNCNEYQDWPFYDFHREPGHTLHTHHKTNQSKYKENHCELDVISHCLFLL